MNSVRKQLEGYQHLIAIARDLASTLDLDDLLTRIIHAATDIVDAEVASILLYDDVARQLNFQVATNLDLQTMRGLVVPLEGSIAGWIVTNRKPVRIDNAHEDSRFYKGIEKAVGYTTESLLGAPLITKDKVVGVLEAINKNTGEFSKADEDLLLVLGAQAAVAIENARLFQQSDLIAEFVHELRTPLASIGTTTYLLLRPEISQGQREQMIHNIHRETLRLNTLASSFLDLARLESGRVEYHLTKFKLLDLLGECCEIMASEAKEKDISINLEIPPNLPEVKADRDKIKQVVLNLLSNAIKYNYPNGTVTITAFLGEKDWTLSVGDTGMGIPELSLPYIFQKFYRGRTSEDNITGTGLGLSICRQIISSHGGSIEVESKTGKGSVFIIHLPRCV